MAKIIDGLKRLYPKAQWILRGEEYDGLEWVDTEIAKPTEQELVQAQADAEADYAAKEYQRLRAPEYPDFREYLDGVVKGDQAQIQRYIDACNAVKLKYPKPQ